MTKPLISVIMPVYNCADYVGASIESILAQTFKEFELIIIDDCSTDDTLRIVTHYAKRDSRIVLVINEENLNIGASLNKGIFMAKSDIIARMDGDDLSLPTRLEKQYELLISNPNLAVVGCNMITIDEHDKEIGRRKYQQDSSELKSKMLRYSPFAHPATVYRKKMFYEVGGYDSQLSPTEDLDLWVRIGTKYEFSNVNEFLFKYRVFPTSSSNKKLRNLELKVIAIRLTAIFIYGYKPSIVDILYNMLQLITVYLMPIKIRYKLFNLLRNRELI